jgi:lipopolysaccharide/colanic/teichoic acid biosynthesis glycosyltransferase
MSRLADVLIASVVLVLTFPLLIIVSLAIKWGIAGPVFERDLYAGCRDRRFQLLQFRTTYTYPMIQGRLGKSGK